MKKIIGIDIDAVLTDEGRGDNNIWHKAITEHFNLKERLEDIYDFCKAYGLTMEQVEDFMKTKGLDIFKTVPPRSDCKEVLDRLAIQGYTIILVTARPEECNSITLDWLAKHQIPFDKLYHSEEKFKICRSEGIALFIDDHPAHLISIKEHLNIPVLLMDMDHNQSDEYDFPRVDNWFAIEDIILEIFK